MSFLSGLGKVFGVAAPGLSLIPGVGPVVAAGTGVLGGLLANSDKPENQQAAQTRQAETTPQPPQPVGSTSGLQLQPIAPAAPPAPQQPGQQQQTNTFNPNTGLSADPSNQLRSNILNNLFGNFNG